MHLGGATQEVRLKKLESHLAIASGDSYASFVPHVSITLRYGVYHLLIVSHPIGLSVSGGECSVVPLGLDSRPSHAGVMQVQFCQAPWQP